jgi:hypothetical protein
MIARFILPTTALWLGACAAHVQDAAQAPQPRCALTVFPTNERVAAWSVDKFAGRFASGANTLVVRREEHRLLVEGWTLGRRELTAQSVESWSWRDGCGVRYDFTLPPDGPGAMLKIVMPDGTTTDWHRAG